jgi:hypothetical protein
VVLFEQFGGNRPDLLSVAEIIFIGGDVIQFPFGFHLFQSFPFL